MFPEQCRCRFYACRPTHGGTACETTTSTTRFWTAPARNRPDKERTYVAPRSIQQPPHPANQSPPENIRCSMLAAIVTKLLGPRAPACKRLPMARRPGQAQGCRKTEVAPRMKRMILNKTLQVDERTHIHTEVWRSWGCFKIFRTHHARYFVPPTTPTPSNQALVV